MIVAFNFHVGIGALNINSELSQSDDASHSHRSIRPACFRLRESMRLFLRRNRGFAEELAKLTEAQECLS